MSANSDIRRQARCLVCTEDFRKPSVRFGDLAEVQRHANRARDINLHLRAKPMVRLGHDLHHCESGSSCKNAEMLTNVVLNLRVTLLGFASWVVPFALSFLFFDRTGQLTVPQPLFKSLMVVVGGGIGVALLVAAFRRVEASVLSGVTIGCYWLALNLILDALILVPMSGMTYTGYFADIGLRYILLPVISAGMGAVAQGKNRHSLPQA